MPYRKAPGLRRFFEGVRVRTRPGDAIAIDSPFPSWEHGYEYIYGRSLYPLSGRRALALYDPSDRFLPQNLARAQYVAAYRIFGPLPGFTTVWSSSDGTLQRRGK